MAGPALDSLGSRRFGGVRRVPIWMIDVYRAARHGRPAPCRFVPSCSEFGREAFERHGVIAGAWLTVRRVVRCRPGGASGVDLVPESYHRKPSFPAQG